MRRLRWLVLVLATDLEWCGCWLQREHPAVTVLATWLAVAKCEKPPFDPDGGWG